MTHLLDTNVCIVAMRGNVRVQQCLLAHQPSDCGVSSVTLYELLSGVERCRQPALEHQKVRRHHSMAVVSGRRRRLTRARASRGMALQMGEEWLAKEVPENKGALRRTGLS